MGGWSFLFYLFVFFVGLLGKCEGREKQLNFTQFLLVDDKIRGKEYVHLIALGTEALSTDGWCVVESLLRTTDGTLSDMKIVLWVDQYPTSLSLYNQLSHIGTGKIQFSLFNFSLLFENTPLAEVIDPVLLNDDQHQDYAWMVNKFGMFWKQNFCLAARLSILYRYGGFYLDLDHLVLDDVRNLPIGVGINGHTVGSTAMHFSVPKHPFLLWLMRVFVREFKGGKWTQNSPKLAEITLKKCRDRTIVSTIASRKKKLKKDVLRDYIESCGLVLFKGGPLPKQVSFFLVFLYLLFSFFRIIILSFFNFRSSTISSLLRSLVMLCRLWMIKSFSITQLATLLAVNKGVSIR